MLNETNRLSQFLRPRSGHGLIFNINILILVPLTFGQPRTFEQQAQIQAGNNNNQAATQFYYEAGDITSTHIAKEQMDTQPIHQQNSEQAIGQKPQVSELRCERRTNPVGIDQLNPNFEWQLQSKKRATYQSAYQVRVASEVKLLNETPDLWDSGRVASSQSHYISYGGKTLRSSQKYYWTARLWDNYGNMTEWSEPATFVTGLLSANDWKARWITAKRTDKDPLPIFRKEIELAKPVEDAVIHICGLGQYELRMNGRRVGDREMDPGWTNYRKTCLYSSYDVTNILKQGDNCIGVLLGNGMYNVPGRRYTKFKGTFGPPKLICQLHITFVDGSTQVIASDDTWRYSLGPITFTCIFGGEDYDARREQVGWDKPGFDDSTWNAAIICDGPCGELVAQYAPPIKVDKYLPAVVIKRLDDSRIEVDCDLNLSARPVLKLKGPVGSHVTVYCAEKQGEPWMHNGGHSYTYTLKGQGEEILRPRFTYFSFQYLYISNADLPGDVTGQGERPVLLEAGSEFLTSSAIDVGNFVCSNSLFNDIDAMIERSVRSNLQSILTDCPHREKLGWLEVSHLMGPSILYHRDAHYLYRKICRDTTEAQLDNGFVPNIAPTYTSFKGAFFESPEWSSACVQLPNLLYQWYGDKLAEQQQYETMKRYTCYLADTRNELGLVKPGLGDWYDWTPEKGHVGASQLTPNELPATAFLFDNARIVTRAAKMLGKESDATEFENLSQQVRQDFIKAYYKPAEHSIATGSHASLGTALYFSLIPEEDRQQVLDNLVKEVENAQYRQSTGEVCFRMLVQALAEGGRSDVVYRMINRTDKPGYGNMLRLGYKTLSERWDFPGSSMNHCMFGQIQEWFQNSIVGIRQAPDSIGFKHIILRPEPVGDLTWASGHYDSMHGRIESNWRIENNQFQWKIAVPANTTAEVYVPAIDKKTVTESGKAIEQAEGVKFLRMEPVQRHASFPRAIYEVGSGTYQFRSRIK
jgi:alpha-L-rhamnosidase